MAGDSAFPPTNLRQLTRPWALRMTTPALGWLASSSPAGQGWPVTMIGGADRTLSEDEVRRFVLDSLADADLDGRSVCVVVPDGTRSCPLPLLLSARCTGPCTARVSRLTVLVALGTHAPMDEAALARHLGYPPGGLAERYPGHDRAQPRVVGPGDVRVRSGRIGADASPSCPKVCCAQAVDVRLNRAVVEHDVTLVVGPGLPARGGRVLRRQQVLLPRRRRPGGHRRVALARCPDHQRARSSGRRGRRRSARSSTRPPRWCPGGGWRCASSCSPVRPPCTRWPSAHPRTAWAAAADVSAQAHIRYLDAPVRRVLSLVPREVPRPLDRGQGLLQGRAGRGRRRRGGALRAAHQARSQPCTRRSSRSATTAATTSSASGTGSATCPGATLRTRPTCAVPGT